MPPEGRTAGRLSHSALRWRRPKATEQAGLDLRYLASEETGRTVGTRGHLGPGFPREVWHFVALRTADCRTYRDSAGA